MPKSKRSDYEGTGPATVSNVQEKAAPFRNETKSADWQKYSGAKPIDYGAIEAKQAAPTLLSDPSGWWAALTDDQKQEVLNSVGELAGGTVGGIAGGGTPASIPAAGVGALAGKDAARILGRKMGIKEKPKTAGEEAADAAATFALNAGGEAVGTGLALGKQMLKGGLQKAIRPNLGIARLADNVGAQITPGMVSSRPLVQKAEAALENTLGGTEKIRRVTNAAIDANEAGLGKIQNKVYQRPVERPEAGTALKDQLALNRASMDQAFDKKYKPITAVAGGATIDVTPFRDQAAEFLTGLNPKLEGFFGSGDLKQLKQAAGLGDPGGLALYDAHGKKILFDAAEPQLTFEQAQKLRTALLKAERNMTDKADAIKREMIPGLRSALDESIDASLSTHPDPAVQAALPKWRQINAEYRKAQARIGKQNPTADSIYRMDNPDDLVSQIAHSPTSIRETDIATTPVFGAANEEAMAKLRRQQLDKLVEGSKTKFRWSPQETVVNPDTMERKLRQSDALREITAPVSPELQDNITLGKAIVAPAQHANLSGTALASHFLQYGTGAGTAVAGAAMGDDDMMTRGRNAVLGGLVGGYGLPKLAAKAWTSPRLLNAVTGSVPAYAAPKLAPLLGASSRALMGMSQLPEPEAPASLEAPAIAPRKSKRSDYE